MRVRVADDLLTRIHELSKGVVRRICVNLELAQQAGLEQGLAEIGLDAWGSRPFYTGKAPVREVRR